MRITLAFTLLAGCMQPPDDVPSTGECNRDDDCGGNVCARDGWCHPAAAVREIMTTWTIRGMRADPITCKNAPDLEITFTGTGGDMPMGYAPVPCENGQWLMDKLPRSFTSVELGRKDGVRESMVVGSDNVVAFDLRL